MFQNWQEAQLEFFKNENGAIEFADPGLRYKRRNDKRNTNAPIGQGYCKFKTTPTLPHKSGVYALFADNALVYIGKAMDLSKRWSNTNYCSISPKNVFYNGQSTNCKINHFILERKKEDKRILLKFICTDDYSKLEKKLIDEFKPQLNAQGTKTPKHP